MAGGGRHELLQFCSLDDPSGDARRFEFIDAETPAARRLRLFRVWSDDLEITRRSQRDEGVTRAESRMLAARSGFHTEEFLDRVDAEIQIRRGVDQMVDAHQQ